jgi:hypothetical protein
VTIWQFSHNRGFSNILKILTEKYYTGRFIMYCWINEIYDRKTVGNVFKKPVQIEGKTQKCFSRKLFFIVIHISAARRCDCMYKNIDAPMLTRVWQELEYRIDVCSITRAANIEHI